jgi:hypothetical protein
LPAAGFLVFCHANYDDEEHPPDHVLVCAGIGLRVGPPLHLHLFNWIGSGLSGYHYDPLWISNEPLDLSFGVEDAFVGGSQGLSAGDSLDADVEMLDDEFVPAVVVGAATPEVVVHSGADMIEESSGDGGAGTGADLASAGDLLLENEGVASGAVPMNLPPSLLPNQRRVLQRRNAMGGFVPGVEHLRTALRRLSLGAMVEAAVDAPSIELVDDSMDLATSCIDPVSSRFEQLDVVARSAAMASSGDGAEPGVVAPELFARSSIAEEKCRARIYSEQTMPVLFSQCAQPCEIREVL